MGVYFSCRQRIVRRWPNEEAQLSRRAPTGDTVKPSRWQAASDYPADGFFTLCLCNLPPLPHIHALAKPHPAHPPALLRWQVATERMNLRPPQPPKTSSSRARNHSLRVAPQGEWMIRNPARKAHAVCSAQSAPPPTRMIRKPGTLTVNHLQQCGAQSATTDAHTPARPSSRPKAQATWALFVAAPPVCDEERLPIGYPNRTHLGPIFQIRIHHSYLPIATFRWSIMVFTFAPALAPW